MRHPLRKQYRLLSGLPILSRTVLAVDRCPLVERICLVVPKEDVDYCRNEILSGVSIHAQTLLVPGGAERQESVYNGLLAAESFADLVAIHDGVRPLVEPETFTRCIETAIEHGGCAVGIPVSETVKQVSAEEGTILKTLDRDTLWLAQTPQAFRYDLIRNAHEYARQNRIRATDDALLMERMGYAVKMIQGSRLNLKITTPEDLQIAEALLAVKHPSV